MVSSGSKSRLESPVSTQQSPLTNRSIPWINTRSKRNRSRSIEYAPPQGKFQQYREVLAVLMAIYKDGKFTESEIVEAIDLLQNSPIHCITFVELLAELQQGWLRRTTQLAFQQKQVD
ncbi:hypothetical protein L873DRAFT_1070451 [Choiromyces venosus 120613-1]|uniref:Uncharacterized protein n=1 Tax=Choiromyces venosus 120613-1 TaxID=1336337 RepID=A0A3N4K963_9PEZI|nr:hypothetical protein L873DRAFT_1070451 [Choiromyces venosus 120613-1]